MSTARSLILNLIFFIQTLLLFLVFFDDKVVLPLWLQVAGRLHPAILHLPIGLVVLAFLLVILQKEFKKKSLRKVMLIVLTFASLSASVTALLGFFLSQQSDYGAEGTLQHRIAGVTLSFLCYGLLVVFNRGKELNLAFYLTGIITFGCLLFAGHSGASITHGENYVFAPLMKSNEAVDPDKMTVYQAGVKPVLERKCFSCHNESKAKGKLVMTSEEAFKKGGKSGKVFEEGNSSESRLIKYLHLPLEHEDHMPPKEKPQLTVNETKLLEQWIKSGASFETKFAELKDEDSLHILISFTNNLKVKSFEPRYEFAAAPEEVIRKLNTPFRVIFPLYQNSPALQVEFFVKEMYKSSALDELQEIKDQIVILNLSKIPVEDEELKIVGSFQNLEKLNINFSDVKSSGLSQLKNLRNLQSLSISGTDVDAKSLESILANSALKEVFIWNTKITEEERVQLTIQFPHIAFITTQFVDDKILKLSKPVLAKDGLIENNELIVLKHAMPGVVIHYELNDAKMDSLSERIYIQPISIKTTTKIKAMACKPGWYCSDVFETILFLKGIKPINVELLSVTDKQYRGEGQKSLSDDRKGFTDVLKEPSWLGFKDTNFEASFHFGNQPPVLNEIVISYGRNLGSSAFPPAEVQVYAGKNKSDMKLIKLIKPDLPKGYDTSKVDALSISLPKAQYSWYKIVAKPVSKLPQWHSSKGKKAWFFVDEVFFY
jgi:uncharacterized membrane protein